MSTTLDPVRTAVPYEPEQSGQPRRIDKSHVAVIVPTRNASPDWSLFSAGIRQQGLPAAQVLIVDCSSNDNTCDLAAAEGYRVVRIDRQDFNHGGTRQLALQHVPWATLAVYLTQDAVLASSDALDRLLSAFADPAVAAAYGRQLPRPGAGAIEAHARLFNYPVESGLRDMESRRTLGIKAAFLSNSFAAFRIDALCQVGGFPTGVIMAEDALAAARLLVAGWKIAYVADAQVYHSHAFTVSQEFRRYFDTGVYHRHDAWLIEKFGSPLGEGRRFVLSELAFLTPRYLHLVPIALFRTLSKAIAYHLGLNEAKLSRSWCRRLSSHREFWGTDRPSGKTAPPEV